MIEIFSRINSLAFSNGVILNTLTFTFSCLLIAWYAQYHWKRRKLYRMAAQRKGPRTLPFIGNYLYFLGSASDVYNTILQLSNEYESPVPIWLGQELFFGICTPSGMEAILNSPSALEKADQYKYLQVIGGTGLIAAPVTKWKRHRKLISPTFNQKILLDFVDVFAANSKILLKQLEMIAGKGTFDIFDYVSRCTLDSICETAMGLTVNAQTEELDYVSWSNIAVAILFKRVVGVLHRVDMIFNLMPSAKVLKDVTTKMSQFTGTVVTKQRKAYHDKLRENKQHPEVLYMEESPTRTTFLQQLLELSEEGAQFTDEELRDEVNTFMVAGSETTASSSSFVFIMLGMFPEIQDRVYQDVMDVVGPDKPVEGNDLSKLKYLDMVIKETLRLFPVAPVIARYVSEDIQLDNCTIPAGCSAGLVIIKLHRDSNIWPDPLKFDPDRFLPEEISNRHPYSWLPFSGGARNCIGIRYGMMAIKTTVATTIRKCRISTDYKRIEDIKLKADLVLKPEGGYRVSIEIRD